MRSATSNHDLIVPTIPVNGLSTLPAVLSAVRSAKPDGPILSVYLDTAPTRVMAGGHLLGLRACAKALRASGELATTEAQRAFEEALARVETYLGQVEAFDHPGWACFASSDHRFFYATPLPAPEADQITWSTEAALEPLERALDEHERVAMVVIDSEQSRIFSIFLGGIEQAITVDGYVEPKHHGGGWLGLEEKKASRRRDQQLLRHIRHTIQVLARELRLHPFDRLIVAGPDEAAALLVRELPPVLANKLAGQASIPLYATHSEICQLAREIAERAERESEIADVDRVLEAVATSRASAGIAATLDALADRRVQRLIIAADFAAVGGHCETCDRLVLGLGPCPVCDAALAPVDDMREAIVAAARATGAAVEFVSGQASDTLMEHGGLAAWTYFD